MRDWVGRCHFGDVRAVLQRMIDAGVQVDCIFTSPPYWGLRKYLPDGHPDQQHELGHEPSLSLFIDNMAAVFDLARQVLKPGGTCWVNMGDSYATDHVPAHSWRRDRAEVHQRKRDILGFKDKDLLMQPHRLAIAMQDRGWWVRADIVWSKPNPLPESAKDRPCRSHEYLFQFSKSESYYFNFEAFREPTTGGSHARVKKVAGWVDGEGKHSAAEHNRDPRGPNGVDWSYRAGIVPGEQRKGRGRVKTAGAPNDIGRIKARNIDGALNDNTTETLRNRRTVWTIPTEPYAGAHYATFPRDLVRPALLGGCPPGGIVLDIFMGSGTTAEVAQELGMEWIGIDLDGRNHQLQQRRVQQPALGLSLPGDARDATPLTSMVSDDAAARCRTDLTDDVGHAPTPSVTAPAVPIHAEPACSLGEAADTAEPAAASPR